MKKMLMLLLFIIVLSGTAYSRTVYLVVPKDAYSNLTYYAADESGEVTINEETDLLNKKYMGNDKLYNVVLTASSQGNFKMMARYKMDGEYYFMVSPDADVDSIKSNFSSTATLSEVNAKFTSYSNYPGININNDMRLSMVPVTEGSKNITEVTEKDILAGKSGISPTSAGNDNNNKEFKMKVKVNGENQVYGLKKNSGNDYDLWSETKDAAATNLEFNEINELIFTSKTNKIDAGELLNEDGVPIKDNENYTYKDDDWNLEATFDQGNGGNGDWYVTINATSKSGETLVFIEDTGTVVSSGIDVESKVKNKSRKRDTRIETNIFDNSESFVIENIKE